MGPKRVISLDYFAAILVFIILAGPITACAISLL